MPKVRGALIDLDGTIRDSRVAIYPAVEHALEQHDIHGVSVEEASVHMHSLRALHANFAPDVDYEKFRDSYDGRIAELLPEIKVYGGAKDLLESLKKVCKTGLVSSSRFADEAVKADGLSEYFDTIVTGTEVTNHKPDPEPIHLALERLELEPGESVMIGDLPADILAGKAAKVLATIGVTHGFGTREALEEAGADYVVDSLDEIPTIIQELEDEA